MRVLAQVVVRNEAARFWSSWLNWHVPIFGADNVHVYDDNSTDTTASMAVEAGVSVTARSGDSPTPSFLAHEGLFRQSAWNAMERMLHPEPGDWVFCIDSDEFLVARTDETDAVYKACEWANMQRRGALIVSIPEVFSTELADTGELLNPKVRVDGWWARIAGTRLFGYQRGGEFAQKPMGSGSEPTYATVAARSSLQNVWLMHYGYARPEDVRAKYDRYNGLVHGHADNHIQSIVATPTLVPWDGPLVNVHLGQRPAPGPGPRIEIPMSPITEEH